MKRSVAIDRLGRHARAAALALALTLLGSGGAAAQGLDASAELSADAGPSDAGVADAAVTDAAIGDASLDSAAVAATPTPPPPALTPVPPEPAPVLEPPVAPTEARDVISIIVGLLMLFGLASLLSHPRVVALQRRVRIQSAITAGFPFVGLGLLAKHHSIGVLSEDVLAQLTPLLQFGLGWLGFIVGFELDPHRLDKIPERTLRSVGADVLATFVLIGLAGGALMLAFGQEWRDARFLRDALVLATAGAMTSPAARGKWRGTADDSEREGFVHFDAIAGALGLAVIAAYFRPLQMQSEWALPGTAWLFISAGMGAALGALVCTMVRSTASSAEFMAITLGSVAFAAGMAAHVNLSPLAVCFFTGVVVASYGGEHRESLNQLFLRVEGQIFLVFLAIAGALWQPADYRGWLLMAAFVAARIGGLALARYFVPSNGQSRSYLLKAPISGLSIAVVVSAQALYQGRAVPWLVTAVIGGAIISEVLAQIATSLGTSSPEQPPAPTVTTPLTASLRPPPPERRTRTKTPSPEESA